MNRIKTWLESKHVFSEESKIEQQNEVFQTRFHSNFNLRSDNRVDSLVKALTTNQNRKTEMQIVLNLIRQ